MLVCCTYSSSSTVNKAKNLKDQRASLRVDTRETQHIWYDTIKPVIDKHAPIQHKRVKATKSCPWLTQELSHEITKRDQLKRNKRFDEYKKQRNYELNLVEKAKNNYFSQLVKDKIFKTAKLIPLLKNAEC